MRVASLLFVLGYCVASSWSFDPEELYQHAKRSVEEAQEMFEREQRKDMLQGFQSTKRAGTKSTPFSRKLDDSHNVYVRALEIMKSRHNVSGEHEKTTIRHLRQATGSSCPAPPPSCGNFVNSRYRTFDGSCNNVLNTQWGMANRALNRVAQAAYEDGFDSPRGNFNSRLPNARLLSRTLHPDADVLFPQYTNMVPQFGQFLDHDLSISPEGNSQCCQNQQSNINCWPIGIPSGDRFLRNPGCMDFTRSTPCGGSRGQREQINMNTAYIDASQVYGSEGGLAGALRAFQGGRLKTNDEGLNGFIPTANQRQFTATRVQQTQGKFLVGDGRVNEMPGLAVMHNVFLMEHNRLATLIQRTRPALTDEQIFQEARRLVVAEMEQITYNEYLPAILGRQAMIDYNLVLPSPGAYSEYRNNVDATIFNAFSTAAYRFGHTLVSGLVALISTSGNFIGNYAIKDQYFQDFQMTQSNGQGYDWILRGLISTSCQKFDRFVTTGLSNHLFPPTPGAFGSDLIARNIQRGRDHGLPNYNTYRNLCGLTPINSWGVQPREMTVENWNALRNMYLTPNDIDLFVGGLHETIVVGGASGPTFNCLKATQFARLKTGDRYFFTHGGQSGSFSSQQLQALRRVTLGDILCLNSQQTQTPRNVFFLPGSTYIDSAGVSTSNPWISCSDSSRGYLQNMNLFV